MDDLVNARSKKHANWRNVYVRSKKKMRNAEYIVFWVEKKCELNERRKLN